MKTELSGFVEGKTEPFFVIFVIIFANPAGNTKSALNRSIAKTHGAVQIVDTDVWNSV